MIQLNLYALLLFIGLTVSCGNSHDHKHSSAEKEKSVTQHQPETSGINTEIELSLNNGAKWKSDEPTFRSMSLMEATLKDFSRNNSDPSEAEYQELGTALSGITQEIINKCSMKGEAHEQLHNVLVPMLSNVGNIKNAGDKATGKSNVEALNDALILFFEHFEL